MEKIEVVKLFKEIDKFYFNRIRLTDEELLDTVNSFYMVLQSYDTSLVLSNFYEHIKSSPHPPTIADLLKEVKLDNYPIPDVQQTKLMIEEKERSMPDTNLDRELVREMIRKHKEEMGEIRYNEYKRNIVKS